MDNHPLNKGLGEGSDKELELLYQLGIALASGKDLFSTLLTLQTAILKLIQADAMFVAIYNASTDTVEYPVYFEVGRPARQASRRLSENPGLTGAVIYSGQSLYLPDMDADEVISTYAPVDDDLEMTLHTFLGIPLIINQTVFGVLSVQSTRIDAYTADQIQLMENVAIQAALAIDKSRLLDQLKRELDERTKVETDLRQRESILEAVTFAAEQFLKTSDWRLNIDRVLERLGITMHVTHAYLFEDHLSAEGEPVTSMRYEWTAPGYPSDLDNPFFKNSKINTEGYEAQVDALNRGEARLGNSSTFNPIEKEAMDEFGVKALLEVPVFVNNKVWGAIGFDEFEHLREWTSAEVDALKVAAGILGAAIQREKTDSAVQEAERIYRQTIEAADAVSYYYDYKTNSYVFMGDGIRTMIGYEPKEVTPALWSRIIEETIDLAGSKGSKDTKPAGSERKPKVWKRDQKIRTRDGKIRWLTDRSVQVLDERNLSRGSIGILQDITDRKLTEAEMRKRESILEAITFSAEQFLKASNWRENIDVVLERLGSEFDATHAYLFEHHPDSNGRLLSTMRYEWTARGYTSDLENGVYPGSHPVSRETDGTDHVLRVWGVFVGNTSTFPESERERLAALGIKAMLEVPLFVRGEWWGTIGLDDMQVERQWSAAEVDALKIAAGILSAAIQRQEAESAVQESERIYRQAIEAAGAVPYIQNYELNDYTFMGEGIQTIIGYKSDEVTPQLWDSMVLNIQPSGELAGMTEEEAIRAAREGRAKAWKCDYQIRTPDGKTRWIADSAVELFAETGISYGSIGILQDITERKLVEAHLRQRESLFEALTFSAEQFLKSADWRERINMVLERLGKEFNASHAYLFEKHLNADGESLDSLRYEWVAPGQEPDIDKPIYQNAPADEQDYEEYYKILDSGDPFVGSHSRFTDAQKRWMESTGIKALLEMRIVVNGKQWGTIGFDDKMNEREWTTMEVDVIRVAANVLGAAIQRQMDEAALQKELEQRALLISELESKNQELERFTYTVSHDLKSPLVTISGFLGYLEQDAVSGNIERLRQDTRRIHDAVAKMQRLLSELLELSRIGRIMNAPEVISFHELIHDAMDVVQGRLRERSIMVHIQPNLPPVYGDKPRLVEVLQNLLDNAAKYMGNQPHPHIEIGQSGEELGKPIFYIQDNGIGIAPEHYERIFGLFNKLDVKSEGTGVGLALVRRILDVHGGRIWIESEESKGSKFLFTLPTQPHSDSVI